jgi:hypothetical protein
MSGLFFFEFLFFTAEFSHLFSTNMCEKKNVFARKICDQKVTKFYSKKKINKKKSVLLFSTFGG